MTPHRKHLAAEIIKAVEQGDTLHTLSGAPRRTRGPASTPEWAGEALTLSLTLTLTPTPTPTPNSSTPNPNPYPHPYP